MLRLADTASHCLVKIFVIAVAERLVNDVIPRVVLLLRKSIRKNTALCVKLSSFFCFQFSPHLLAKQMDRLPEEILNAIFRKLHVRSRLMAEQVCPKWSRCMPYDGKALDLVECLCENSESAKIDTIPISHFFKTLMTRCGPHLERISFGKNYLLITPAALNIVISSCANLTELDLSFCTLTENSVPLLLNLADQLLSLNLRNTGFSVRDVPAFTGYMVTLFNSFTKLQKINLQNANRNLLPAVKYLPSTLESINLNQCVPLKAHNLLHLLCNCTELRELRLSAYTRLDQVILEAIANLPKMEILELSHLAFWGMISNHSLQELDFTVLFSLRHLTELHLQNNSASMVNDGVLAGFCAACPDLRTLNMAFNSGLSDFRPLGRLGKLKSIRLAGTDRFSDADVGALCANGALLELQAANCARLTAHGLSVILESACATNLAHLSLTGHWGSSGVSAVTFALLMERCTALRTLVLHSCDKLGADLFLHVETLPVRMECLDLNYCTLINDDSVMRLSDILERDRDRRRGLGLIFHCHQSRVTRDILGNVSPLLKVMF